MSPVKRTEGKRRRLLPGHYFLGPGTKLKRVRFAPPRSELDWAAKLHDLDLQQGFSFFFFFQTNFSLLSYFPIKMNKFLQTL